MQLGEGVAREALPLAALEVVRPQVQQPSLEGAEHDPPAVGGEGRALELGEIRELGLAHLAPGLRVHEDGNIDILSIFSEPIRRMAEGELLQLERSFDPEVTEAHYYAVIDHKSASLIAAATEAGAILGGVTRAERRRLREFGREFGTAFQLRDDALDYAAGEAELGKLPYTDVREGKVTLPLLLALKRCLPAERETVAAVLKTAARRSVELEAEGLLAPERVLEPSELAPVLDVVKRYRGVEDTHARAAQHAQRAAEAVAPFPDGPVKQALAAAAWYTLERDS